MSIRSISIACLALVLSLGPVPGRAAAAAAPTILVLGDSLSAGYGIRIEQGWVALLQQRLRAQGYGYRVVNASSSGETTGGAAARLPRALQLHAPDIVIIELGGNDGLRGLPIADVRRNFEKMLALARGAGARVVLVGMRIPPNYGPKYRGAFDALYGELARAHQLPLVPFFLDGIALDEALMQADGLHPTAAAQPKLLEAVWAKLAPQLER